jgi:hypothetical protein
MNKESNNETKKGKENNGKDKIPVGSKLFRPGMKRVEVHK